MEVGGWHTATYCQAKGWLGTKKKGLRYHCPALGSKRRKERKEKQCLKNEFFCFSLKIFKFIHGICSND